MSQDQTQIVEETGSEQSDTPQSSGAGAATDTNQLITLFKPVLYGLEEQVHRVATSQVELRTELDGLLNALRDIKNRVEQDTLVTVLEAKAKKLVALKRRLTLVHTILQNSNERCRKLMISNKISIEASQ